MTHMTKTRQDIHKFTLPTPFDVGPVNVYLIKGERLTLIDTGARTPESWSAFTTQLTEAGYQPTDVEQIILTHHHPDHVGMLDYFASDIPVLGHFRNDPWLRHEAPFVKHVNAFFATFYAKMGLDAQIDYFAGTQQYSCTSQLTQSLQDGDDAPGLPGWRILETPGHASSHIALYHEADQVLVGGDLIIDRISSNPIIEPPFIGEKTRPRPQLQYNQSLKNCLDLDISMVYSGHGKEVTDVHDLLRKRLTKQAERAEKVYQMLKEKPQTAFQLCQRLFPAVYEQQLGLTMSETIAQLDYLEDLGDIVVNQSGNQWIFMIPS